MEIIKKTNAIRINNSGVCELSEYSFENKNMDLGIATLTGRYPDKGYCVNSACMELIYVLEGDGNLCFADKSVDFSAGDSLLIDKGEKYYWETDYCKVAMVCTPAWNVEQYKLVE
ncbi:MAG: hypothetical protein Q4D57_04300 [Clostridia bacterium]|nr:hypothetical protein [Clostridia bacterium]